MGFRSWSVGRAAPFAATLALSLGTAGTAAHATDIRFIVSAYSEKSGPFFEQVAKDYTALHPDVHVKIEVVSWETLYQKLTTDISAGTPPDMSIIGTRWLYAFAAQGVT